MQDRADVTSHWLRNIAAELKGDAYPQILRAAADELDALRHRAKMAVAALNQAPDLPDGRVTRAQADAMRLANVLAWTFLTDGQDPPSQRRASEAPEGARCSLTSET